MKEAAISNNSGQCPPYIHIADFMKTQNPEPSTQNPAPKPKALVLYGYGLNCDYETAFALSRAGAEAVRVHTTDLLENPGLL